MKFKVLKRGCSAGTEFSDGYQLPAISVPAKFKSKEHSPKARNNFQKHLPSSPCSVRINQFDSFGGDDDFTLLIQCPRCSLKGFFAHSQSVIDLVGR